MFALLFLGIAVNVYQQAVYFSVGNSIWVKGAASMSDVSDLKLFYTGLGTITSISVDWIYQMMYFVMNAKVGVWGLKNFIILKESLHDLFCMRRQRIYEV